MFTVEKAYTGYFRVPRNATKKEIRVRMAHGLDHNEAFRSRDTFEYWGENCVVDEVSSIDEELIENELIDLTSPVKVPECCFACEDRWCEDFCCDECAERMSNCECVVCGCGVDIGEERCEQCEVLFEEDEQ